MRGRDGLLLGCGSWGRVGVAVFSLVCGFWGCVDRVVFPWVVVSGDAWMVVFPWVVISSWVWRSLAVVPGDAWTWTVFSLDRGSWRRVDGGGLSLGRGSWGCVVGVVS